MRVQRIRKPLQGEHVLAVWPTMRPEVQDARWRRRLNLYTGRSLSAPALISEQEERGGRLATRGQMVSPGVVSGLEAGVESVTEGGVARIYLQVAPGTGLCASGEDVFLHQPLRVRLDQVVAQSVLPAPGAGGAADPGALAAFLAEHPLTVGTVRLEPVTIDVFGRQNREDPCEQDPSEYAYDDETTIDACRAGFWLWQDLLSPASSLRNQLANSIFERERTRAPGQLFPWEEEGVALATCAFDSAGALVFFDRFSVVRQGGKARPRSALVPGSGGPLSWQSRLRQFTDEVQSWRALGVSPADIAASRVRFLPPVGFLPTGAVALKTGQGPFFPGYEVDARPVPVEQLDEVIAGCAALASFDLTVKDRVRVLVPVPQALYEPHLLEDEVPDPEFQATLKDLRGKRNNARFHRDAVRAKGEALLRALSGASFQPQYPPDADADPGAAADPAAAEKPEQMAGDPVTEQDYGTATRAGVLVATAFDDLREDLKAHLLSADEADQMVKLGLRGFVPFLEQRLKEVNDSIDFGYLSSQTDIYRLRQHMLGTADASRLAVSPALATIAEGSTATAVREDLLRYFQKIKIPTDESGVPPASGIGPGTVTPVVTGERVALSRTFVAPLAKITLSPGLGGAAARGGFTIGAGGIAGLTKTAIAGRGPVEAGGEAIVAATAGLDQRRAIDDVLEQDPGAGNTYDFGNVTVGERLKAPGAQQAHDFAKSNLESTVNTFTGLAQKNAAKTGGINLSGVPLYGKKRKTPVDGKDTFTYGDYDPAAAVDTLALPTTPTEADYFNFGVQRIENTISNLRALEVRVRDYRVAVARCRDAVASEEALLAQVAARLKALDDELGGARHSVATAWALLQDELARVAAVNQRRADVLAKAVPFVAFHRPRLADTLDPAPMRPLDPALTEQPVPACLARHASAPPELLSMVELLRDAPARWFTFVPRIVDGLDDLGTLHMTVVVARARAYAQYATDQFGVVRQASSGFYSDALDRVYGAQQEIIRNLRLRTASLDLASFVGLSWRESRERALDHVSLGDLADGRHGRARVARQAAQELEDIASVASCIYVRASGVRPVLRLEWAERLSQADGTSLRNLASLPRWSEVPSLDRKEMQILVDWLYHRVDAGQAEAVAMMHDVVRVCILLASHAPVNQILAGKVPAQAAVVVGGTIKLGFDATRVQLRVGMQAMLYATDQGLVRGVVEDISEGQAIARVIRASSASVTVAAGSQVQFSEAAELPPRLVV